MKSLNGPFSRVATSEFLCAIKGSEMTNGIFPQIAAFDSHVIVRAGKEGKKGNANEGSKTSGAQVR